MVIMIIIRHCSSYLSYPPISSLSYRLWSFWFSLHWPARLRACICHEWKSKAGRQYNSWPSWTKHMSSSLLLHPPTHSIRFILRRDLIKLAFTVKTCAGRLQLKPNPPFLTKHFSSSEANRASRDFFLGAIEMFGFPVIPNSILHKWLRLLISAKLGIISHSQIKTNGENRHWFVDFTNLGIKALIQCGRGSALPHVRAARRTKRSLGTNKHVSLKCVAAEHCKCWSRCDSEQMQCFCKPCVVIL